MPATTTVAGRFGFGANPAAPCSPANRSARQDRDLQRLVCGTLAEHPHFRGRQKWVWSSVTNGVVCLQGCLPSWYLLQVLLAAVRKVPGVAQIDNQVQVHDPDCPCRPSSSDRQFSGRGNPHFISRGIPGDGPVPSGSPAILLSRCATGEAAGSASSS